MTITIDIAVVGDTKRKTARKEFDSDLVPIIGAYLEDSMWKDERKIEKVYLNYSQGYYLINLGTDRYSDADFADYLKAYEAHGWKIL